MLRRSGHVPSVRTAPPGGDGPKPRVGGRTGRWIGAVLLAQFVLVGLIKHHQGVTVEVLWMSHAGLLLGALGFLRGSLILIGTALVGTLLLHSVWLFDCLAWVATGRFPLNVTAYLATAPALSWVATSHHFYLVPLLAVTVIRAGRLPPESLPGAIALYFVLTIAGRALASPALNVNFAYGVLSNIRMSWLDALNLLPGPAYLLILNLGVTALFFLPAFLGVRLVIRLVHRRAAREIAARTT